MPRRFQFSLKTMLWLMVVVAAFCAGVVAERQFQRRRSAEAIQDIFLHTSPDEPWWQVRERIETHRKKM
jgi:hypothetical protein